MLASVILTAPRVFYAMAKDNLFFKEQGDAGVVFKNIFLVRQVEFVKSVNQKTFI